MIIEFVKKLVLSKSQNKDKARREFILNTLLLGSLVITFFALCIDIVNEINNMTVQDGLPSYVLAIFFVFLLVIFRLSKMGVIGIAAFFLISFFYLPATYTIYKWGAEVAQAWLIYALLIVMSGILIGTRFAFFFSFFIVLTSSIFGFLQASGVSHPNLSWKFAPYSFGDTVLLNITLVIIVVISWLSNREIEKALIRARASEAALKKERDLLEIKVEERTKDLKQAQLEKLTQLYRFAEVGRLSSGLFHDLVTPLSLISLHLERLKSKGEQGNIGDVQTQMKKAIRATKYLESFVKAVRKQLQNEGSTKLFSLNKEIKLVMQMLRHKAVSLGIKMNFHASKEIQIYGDQVKFSQLMINLILNAIDAYEGISATSKERDIQITLTYKDGGGILTVRDKGVGISPENLEKIFQPFFTTKKFEKGTGIGLSISREIVEKYLRGKIYAETNRNKETVFTILFPLQKSLTEKNENLAQAIRN